jgi:predicted Zn-dependent protease
MSPRRSKCASLWRMAWVTMSIASLVMPAHAQPAKPGASIVRDAEIEQLLREYSAPIFRAAGIPTGAAKIILINDRAFNAFVADGRKVFINLGVLMDAKTPNEVIGVIAHESGHIAGGHLARLRQQIATAQILSVAGMLLGAAAVVGSANSGGRVGNSGTGAMGAITGGQELAMRNLLAYQRSEEQAADQAAVRFLNATKQSPKGMLDTFRRFASDSMFISSRVDPYMISHPLPQERVAQLELLSAESPNRDNKDSPALQARHEMMRAKLFGFVDRPEAVLRRYPQSDVSLPARYARTVAAYRQGRLAEAVALSDALIKAQPNNPYFWELKGQILLEGGRSVEALTPLRKAVSMAPSASPIRVMLGHALVATEKPGNIDEAIRELTNAAQRDPEAPEAYLHLSNAHGRKGDIGMADYHSAQHYLLVGDYKLAHTQASRAMAKLPQGSAAWLRAEDILNTVPPKPN